MILTISQIIGKIGESIEVSFSEQIENTTGYPDVVCFSEPVEVKGTLTNTKKGMLFEAEGKIEAEYLCSRCLETVKIPISFNMNEIFYQAGSIERENEKEAETFCDNQIDFTDIIQRNILANLPMKVVCKEDCKGLCSKCGKNLNEGQCDCNHTEFDPRLESLRTLFNVDEEV
ncbi:MAG: DUF177 domain-containing protein [Firmicutes bacterium]|nr:DUF177 domain-containing protein [Bacillota bacterium]